jgi:hypothetical protein
MPPSSDDETGSAGTGPAPALTPTGSTSRDDGAPRYPVASRDLSAVEIPAVVQNVDRAIKAFGRVPSLSHVSVFFNSFRALHAVMYSSSLPQGSGSNAKFYSSVPESRESILQSYHVTQCRHA